MLFKVYSDNIFFTYLLKFLKNLYNEDPDKLLNKLKEIKKDCSELGNYLIDICGNEKDYSRTFGYFSHSEDILSNHLLKNNNQNLKKEIEKCIKEDSNNLLIVIYSDNSPCNKCRILLLEILASVNALFDSENKGMKVKMLVVSKSEWLPNDSIVISTNRLNLDHIDIDNVDHNYHELRVG